MTKITVRETVFDGKEAKGDIPDKLEDFIAWLQSKLEEVPAELRGSASIDLDVQSYDDYALPVISITYYRPETDVEAANRAWHTELARQRDEALRLFMYLELKRTFEPN